MRAARRQDGRGAGELRAVKITPSFVRAADGLSPDGFRAGTGR